MGALVCLLSFFYPLCRIAVISLPEYSWESSTTPAAAAKRLWSASEVRFGESAFELETKTSSKTSPVVGPLLLSYVSRGSEDVPTKVNRTG